MSWQQLQPLSRISRRPALGQSRSPLGTWTPAAVSSVAPAASSLPWVAPKPIPRKSLGFAKPPLVPVEASAPPTVARFISAPYPPTATVSRGNGPDAGSAIATSPPADASTTPPTKPQLPVFPALQRQPLGPSNPPLVQPPTAQSEPAVTNADGNRSQDNVANGTNATPPSAPPERVETSLSSLPPQAADPPIQARETSENRPISFPLEAPSQVSQDASPRVEPTVPTESPPVLQLRGDAATPSTSEARQPISEPTVSPPTGAGESIQTAATVPGETIQAAPVASGETLQPAATAPGESARPQPQSQAEPPPSPPRTPSASPPASRVQAALEVSQTVPAPTAQPADSTAPPVVQALSAGTSEVPPEPTDSSGGLFKADDAAIAPAIDTTEPQSVQPTDPRLPAFPALQRRPLGPAKPPLVQLPIVQRSLDAGTSDRAQDPRTKGAEITAQPAEPGIAAREDREDRSSSPGLPPPSAPPIQARQTSADTAVPPSADSPPIQKTTALSKDAPPPSQPTLDSFPTLQRRSDIAPTPATSPGQATSDAPITPEIDENPAIPTVSRSPLDRSVTIETPATQPPSRVEPITNRTSATQPPSTPSAPAELTREEIVQAAPQAPLRMSTDLRKEDAAASAVQAQPATAREEQPASAPTPTSLPSDLVQAKDAIAESSNLDRAIPSTVSELKTPILPALQRQPLGHFNSLLSESPSLQSDAPASISDPASATAIQPAPAESIPAIPTTFLAQDSVDASFPAESRDLPAIQPKRETAQAPNREATDRIQRLPAPAPDLPLAPLQRPTSAEADRETAELSHRPPLGQPPLQRFTPPVLPPERSLTSKPAIARKQSSRTQSVPTARSQPEAWKSQFALDRPQPSQAEPWQAQFALEPAGGPIAVQRFPQETAVARKEAPPADVIIPEKPVVRRLVNPLSQQQKPAPGESASVDEAQLEQLARICYLLARSRLDLLRENQYGLVGTSPWIDVSVPLTGSASAKTKPNNPPALTAALDATQLSLDSNIQSLVQAVSILLQQRLAIEQERMNLSGKTRF